VSTLTKLPHQSQQRFLRARGIHEGNNADYLFGHDNLHLQIQ
jgi:hypothetical protein